MGARGGSLHFCDFFNRFFNDTLYPYMQREGIDTIVQVGDMFDNRTNLSIRAFDRCKPIWFDKMQKLGINMVTLLGNHDIHYRNTLSINSQNLLLNSYENITIIDKPSTVVVAGEKVDIIPWICEENEVEILKFLTRKERSNLLFGHLELSGFPMYKGSTVNQSGPVTSLQKALDGYELVWSGHYHTHSKKGNVIYTGIPYEIAWSDYNDPKGFFVYDTKTRKYEFVKNPEPMFKKLYWNNGNKDKILDLEGKYVKVVVTEKKDPISFELWIDSIKLINPKDLMIVETPAVNNKELEESLDVSDTSGIIKSYIAGLETTVNKDELEKYILDLLNEAHTLND